MARDGDPCIRQQPVPPSSCRFPVGAPHATPCPAALVRQSHRLVEAEMVGHVTGSTEEYLAIVDLAPVGIGLGSVAARGGLPDLARSADACHVAVGRQVLGDDGVMEASDRAHSRRNRMHRELVKTVVRSAASWSDESLRVPPDALLAQASAGREVRARRVGCAPSEFVTWTGPISGRDAPNKISVCIDAPASP